MFEHLKCTLMTKYRRASRVGPFIVCCLLSVLLKQELDLARPEVPDEPLPEVPEAATTEPCIVISHHEALLYRLVSLHN